MATSFHPENFHTGIHGGPHAYSVSAILTAVAISGIVFFAWGILCGWHTPEVTAIRMESGAHPGALRVPPAIVEPGAGSITRARRND